MHFTSLPSGQGIGDIGGAARAFLEQMPAMGLKVWQFLPLGPTGYGDSPYQSLSAFAGNELLIDLEALAAEGLLSPEEVSSLGTFPHEFVDYSAIVSVKESLLHRAAGRFMASASPDQKQAYREFVADHHDLWLDDYVLFRAIKASQDERAWPEWPRELATRQAPAIEAFRADHAQEIERRAVIQFLFHRQWARLRRDAAAAGVVLFGDMPIYVALDSADAWSHPELLRMDERGAPTHVAGCPPDGFTPEGQLWGNPVYDWPRHAATGYAWWLARLAHAAKQFDLVRIDHFRGFEAFWSIPAGDTTAANGAWEPGPGAPLFKAMKKRLGRLPIIAEDLGVITPAVTRLRRRFRLPGMRVLQFAVDEADFKPKRIEPNCVCYTGTHDNDTTWGWFHGDRDNGASWSASEATRARALALSGGTPETIHRDMIRLAFSCPARMAIVPMQDFLGLGSEARMNTPGSTEGNWAWRLRPGDLTGDVKKFILDSVEASDRR